ncbi:hypothetical protein [Streptomyces sp. NPDC088785]
MGAQRQDRLSALFTPWGHLQTLPLYDVFAGGVLKSGYRQRR